MGSVNPMKILGKFISLGHKCWFIPYECLNGLQFSVPARPKKADLRWGAFVAQVCTLLVYEFFLLVGAVKGLQTKGTFAEKVHLCFYVETGILMNIGASVILRHFHAYPSLFHNFFTLLAEYEGEKSDYLLRL